MYSKMFLDLEFNDKKAFVKGKDICEIIQIAYVIYSENLKPNIELAAYQTYVKPKIHSMLSKTIKTLTKISQNDIDSGISFYDAFKKMLSDVKEYNVTKVYTWGDSDLNVLRDNFVGISDKVTNAESGVILSKISDISRKISSLFSNTVISLSDMASLFNISTVGHHNAMNDAQMLALIFIEYKKCLSDKVLKFEYVNKYKQYIEEKAIYHNLKIGIKSALKCGVDYNALIDKIIKNEDNTYHRFLSYEKWSKTSTNEWCRKNF